MKIEYSHTADAIYVYFREVEAARSDDIAEGVVVDFDAQGQIVGIEILDVSSRLSAKDLANVTIENLPAVMAEQQAVEEEEPRKARIRAEASQPMSQADGIRQYALEHFIEPARRIGRRYVEIRLGAVQEGIEERSNVPNFINALGGKKFLKLANLKLLRTSGAKAGPNTVFHYEILGQATPKDAITAGGADCR